MSFLKEAQDLSLKYVKATILEEANKGKRIVKFEQDELSYPDIWQLEKEGFGVDTLTEKHSQVPKAFFVKW